MVRPRREQLQQPCVLHQSVLLLVELPWCVPREDDIRLPNSLGPVLRRVQPHQPGTVREPCSTILLMPWSAVKLARTVGSCICSASQWGRASPVNPIS